jgi:hypothetical protein
MMSAFLIQHSSTAFLDKNHRTEDRVHTSPGLKLPTEPYEFGLKIIEPVGYPDIREIRQEQGQVLQPCAFELPEVVKQLLDIPKKKDVRNHLGGNIEQCLEQPTGRNSLEQDIEQASRTRAGGVFQAPPGPDVTTRHECNSSIHRRAAEVIEQYMPGGPYDRHRK